MTAAHDHYLLASDREQRGPRPCAWCGGEPSEGQQPVSLICYPPASGVGIYWCDAHSEDAADLRDVEWTFVRRMREQ